MQTRRDQVQAHSFVAGRLVSALLRAEPDAPTTPLRPYVVGMFIGMIAGIVLIAGFGIFGYIKPGGKKSFRQPGALIVEKETGARYVLVDGELKPVLNYASAKLILGEDLRVVNVSRNSLKGVPHGLPVGIASAPDFLPDAGKLTGTNWQVCSSQRPDVSGQQKPFVSVQIGGQAAAGTQLSDAEALIVITGDGTRYLAWKNRRLRVASDAVLGALGYGTARAHPVGAAFVNALPAGPDLAPPDLPGRGGPGPEIAEQPTLVGQLFKVESAVGQEQFFLVTPDGLAPLTPAGAALVLGDSRTRSAYPNGRVTALPLDPAALASAPLAEKGRLDPGLPATPPQVLSETGDAVPCLQIVVGSADGAEVRVALGSPPAPKAARSGAATTGGSLADQVTVEPGSGLLARDLPAPGVANGTRYLVTDTGVRYPLPGDAVVGTLGYGGVSQVPVPTTLLGLIPAGRPLDPAAARSGAPIEAQTRTGGEPI